MGVPQRGQASFGSDRVRVGSADFLLRLLFIIFGLVFMAGELANAPQ